MELLVAIIFFWLPLCIAVAILASRYNRSGFGWLIFSLLLSPLLGFAFVLACGPLPADVAQHAVETPAPDTRTWDQRHADRVLARHGHWGC